MGLLIALAVLVLIDVAAMLWGKDSTRLSEIGRTERFGLLR